MIFDIRGIRRAESAFAILDGRIASAVGGQRRHPLIHDQLLNETLSEVKLGGNLLRPAELLITILDPDFSPFNERRLCIQAANLHERLAQLERRPGAFAGAVEAESASDMARSLNSFVTALTCGEAIEQLTASNPNPQPPASPIEVLLGFGRGLASREAGATETGPVEEDGLLLLTEKCEQLIREGGGLFEVAEIVVLAHRLPWLPSNLKAQQPTIARCMGPYLLRLGTGCPRAWLAPATSFRSDAAGYRRILGAEPSAQKADDAAVRWVAERLAAAIGVATERFGELELRAAQWARAVGRRHSRSRLPEVLQLLAEFPVITSSALRRRLGISQQGADFLVHDLLRARILRPDGSRNGTRLYATAQFRSESGNPRAASMP